MSLTDEPSPCIKTGIKKFQLIILQLIQLLASIVNEYNLLGILLSHSFKPFLFLILVMRAFCFTEDSKWNLYEPTVCQKFACADTSCQKGVTISPPFFTEIGKNTPLQRKTFSLCRLKSLKQWNSNYSGSQVLISPRSSTSIWTVL